MQQAAQKQASPPAHDLLRGPKLNRTLKRGVLDGCVFSGRPVRLWGCAGCSYPSHPTPGKSRRCDGSEAQWRERVAPIRLKPATIGRVSARACSARRTPSPTPPCSDGNRGARRCCGFAPHRLRIGLPRHDRSEARARACRSSRCASPLCVHARARGLNGHVLWARCRATRMGL